MGEGMKRAAAAAQATRQRYRIVQDGMTVAWAEGSSAAAEIAHYAAVYGQDGPVTVEKLVNRRWKRVAGPLETTHDA